VAWLLITAGIPLLWITATHAPAHNPIPLAAIAAILPQPFRRHLHWLLWCVIIGLLLKRRTEPIVIQKSGWQRFIMANRVWALDIMLYLASGLTGFIMTQNFAYIPVLLLGLSTVAGLALMACWQNQRPSLLLGVLLIPLACDLSSLSPAIATVLKLQN
jgi:hypothetical protein